MDETSSAPGTTGGRPDENDRENAGAGIDYNGTGDDAGQLMDNEKDR